MNIKMIDTRGGHYRIVLDMTKKPDSNVLYLKDVSQDVPEDVPVLFLEDSQEDFCSFKALRKVHKINIHRSREQMIAAYHNAG